MSLTPEMEALVEAGRECQAVWRCAIGDATTSLDVLKDRWLKSRRKHEREAGAVLAAYLDHVWAGRDPAPKCYKEAASAGKAMITRIRNLSEQEGGR